MSSLSDSLSKQPWYILLEHVVVILGAGYVARQLTKGGLINNLTRLTLDAVAVIPGAKSILDKEQQDAIDSIQSLIFDGFEDPDIMEELPEIGYESSKVMEILEMWRAKEDGYKSGKAFGGIYADDHEVEELEKKALSLYCDSNGLYPTTFPGLRKLEAEVVRMSCNLMHGGPETCGTMTSGGSESILCAMKTYRDRAKQLYGITEPEIIIPESAHAAFIKGVHYFGYKMVIVGHTEDYRADVAEIKRNLNRNTVMVVAGAPSFPRGVVDPVEEIAALLINSPQTGLHVDACLGGFILPWVQKLGKLKRKWDFELPGVTSISADLHKYGFTPKGASVILYKNSEYRKFQYFAYTNWSGGLYCSPAMQGSRAGGPMAGAWAVLVHMGKNGYLKSATKYLNDYETVIEGIKSIPELRVLGDPDGCVIAYDSKDAKLDIFKVGDAMLERGWTVNRLQKPPCLHIQVGAKATFDADAYVQCIRECVSDVLENPDKYKGGMAGIYGLANTLACADAVGPVKAILGGYMDALYLTRPTKK